MMLECSPPKTRQLYHPETSEERVWKEYELEDEEQAMFWIGHNHSDQNLTAAALIRHGAKETRGARFLSAK